MAQGTVKSKPKSAPPKPKTRAGITRKGTQNLAPKKSSAIKRQKELTKKFSSGLVAKTEKMLGEKAQYLELIGGGRKRDGTTLGKKDGDVKKAKK